MDQFILETLMVPNLLSLRLSERKIKKSYRPWTCPYCGSSIMQRWGKVVKPGWNPNQEKIVGYRYKCEDCRRTFRAYRDEGATLYSNQDVRRLAVLAWMVGLSLTNVVELFEEFDVHMSRSTVWRATRDLLGEKQYPGPPLTASVVQHNESRRIRSLLGAEFIVLMEIGMRHKVRIRLTTDEPVPEVRSWLQALASELELEVVTQGSEDGKKWKNYEAYSRN